MARDIHPELTTVNVKCSGCGNSFQVHAVMAGNSLDIEDCHNCHPAFTKQARTKITGSAEAFSKKFAGFDTLTSLSKHQK